MRQTIPARGALAALATLVATLAPGVAGAQTPADSLQAELARLKARVDSLEALVRRLEAARPGEPAIDTAGDPLERLRAAAQEAAAGPGEPADRDTTAVAGAESEFAGRQRSLQALNPEISLNADVLGHLDTDDADRQNFVPREFEFSFQSALDPYSRARVYVSHHAAGPELVPFEEEEGHEHAEEEGGFDVEEGYVEWVGLPAGLGLKLGKFFQRFGALNRWHAHALPFQSRSLPHLAFIGEGSLAQTGASLSWLVPLHGFGAYDATVEVTRSSNEGLFGEASRPSVLAHLNGFWQLSGSSDLDLGVSWLHGRFESETATLDRNLYGVEAAYTWRPPARSRYRELVVRGGAMLLDGLPPHEGEEEVDADDSARGLWSLAELRLSQQWVVGGRFDWTENPAEPDETAWLFSPTLTWWQSEWVRLRLEYDLLGRSALDEREGRLWLQATFAMGPHKHETY